MSENILSSKPFPPLGLIQNCSYPRDNSRQSMLLGEVRGVPKTNLRGPPRGCGWGRRSRVRDRSARVRKNRDRESHEHSLEK